MGSAPTFYKACREKGIKPILGCELYVVPDDMLGEHSKEATASSRHLTVIALSVEGYHNLVAWTTFSMHPDNFYYKPRISLEMMAEIAPFGLHHNVILTGCMGSALCQDMLHLNGTALAAGDGYLYSLKSFFPNVYVEIQDHRGFKIDRDSAYGDMCANEGIVRAKLIQLAHATGTPMVVTNDSHFQSTLQRQAHFAWNASKGRARESEAHHRAGEGSTMTEYERHYIYWTQYMQPIEPLAERALGGADAQRAVSNLADIVAEVDIRLDPIDKGTYSIPFSGYGDPIQEMRSRSKSRLKTLVAVHGDVARERFEREIDAMGEFAHYLLIKSDLIGKAERNGILTNTRGSAANSLVCYTLGIHDIDPIRYKLTFERFVNPARKKLPDVDVDVEREMHETFMRIVDEHISALEGEGQLTPICTLGTSANRKSFRRVATALGMEEEQQDRIADLLPQMIDSGMVDEGFDAYQVLKEEWPDLYELAKEVFDTVTSVGQHPCGYVVGTRERPVDLWVPMYWIASSKSSVAQYNMDAIELMGLLKMDWLRLKTLPVVKRVFRMIGKPNMKLRDIPLEDEKTFAMLRAGKTQGTFTFQGKTQRSGCMEVGVESIDDLIVVQALYRPSGTRVHEGQTQTFAKMYCDRRHGREAWEPDNQIVADVLGDTFGLPVFQEQVMDIGYAIGMTDLEVDDVLKAIKKAKGVGRGAAEAFAALKPMFMGYAKPKMSKEVADKLWSLFDAFQGYGFNRGHAASYAIFGYQTAYLKANHPPQFYSALLDVFPEKLKYIASAREEGFRFELPDVNLSGQGFSMGSADNKIRVGLQRVHGLGPKAAAEIVRKQPYSSVEDLRERTARQYVKQGEKTNHVSILADIGAFGSIGIRGSAGDNEMLASLGFTLDKPQAMRGCVPEIREREKGSWRFLGLYRGVETTEGKAFCAKMFWIPNLSTEELLDVKASHQGHYEVVFVKAVDENGIPFMLRATNATHNSNFLAHLAEQCAGSVIVAEGQVKLPFDDNDPPGFGLWGIAGAEEEQPQVWDMSDEAAAELIRLAKEKKYSRRKEKVA